jgi:Fic family protein
MPFEMEKLIIEWYRNGTKDLHPVEVASALHVDFVKIHPFVDGNGRTARLLLNFELMKHGFPPIVIEKKRRLNYYSALDKAHTMNKYTDFSRIVVDHLEQTLVQYLKLV